MRLPWKWSPPIYVTDLAPPLRSLLLEPRSLTRRLVALSEGQFRVRLDRWRWQLPHAEEARLLGLRTREGAWIREVTLFCRDVPTVYARSVIPATALRGKFRRLTHLGTRPLGEFLFTEKGVNRGNMQLLRLRSGHVLYEGAVQRAAQEVSEFWGRRSLFYVYNEPLLVAEIFLTDIVT